MGGVALCKIDEVIIQRRQHQSIAWGPGTHRAELQNVTDLMDISKYKDRLGEKAVFGRINCEIQCNKLSTTIFGMIIICKMCHNWTKLPVSGNEAMK